MEKVKQTQDDDDHKWRRGTIDTDDVQEICIYWKWCRDGDISDESWTMWVNPQGKMDISD